MTAGIARQTMELPCHLSARRDRDLAKDITECHGHFGLATIAENPNDRVAILLCTRSGARFLRSQLNSISGQLHENWQLYASDDGSDDQTWTILAEFQTRVGHEQLQLRRGPGRGFVANFLSLSCSSDIVANYFAYCDQDDIWEPEKLSRALAWLSEIDPSIPALYCSRTHLIDEQGNSIGFSPLFSRTPHFRNAIVQSIAGGNTMVFNAAARHLLMEAGREVVVPSHDWWLYILVTAVGGLVKYDPHPAVRYRVHGANVVGANTSIRARLARLEFLIRGGLRTWTDRHIAALLPQFRSFAPESKEIFIEFVTARRGNVLRRIMHIHTFRVYRQTLLENITLFFAFVLRKV